MMVVQHVEEVCLTGYGGSIRKRGQFLEVKKKDDMTRFNIANLKRVVVEGQHTVSTGVLQASLDSGFEVVFIFRGGTGRFISGRDSLDIVGMQIDMDDGLRLAISKDIVLGCILNRNTLLREWGCEVLDADVLLKADSLDELRGYEGIAARKYFAYMKEHVGEEWSFEGRHKHPPTDPVNAMLSYGYAVLCSRCESALIAVGLHPARGVFHESYRNRPALAFDLMESFRGPVVDRVVMSCLRLGVMTSENFEEHDGGVYLGNGKKAFMERLLSRFSTEVDGYTYDQWIRISADRLISSVKYMVPFDIPHFR